MPLSTPQQEIANDTHRFKVCMAGRRFGKTFLSIRELCKQARHPSREVWYVAPSYRMAKQIVWRKLKSKLLDLKWVQRVNESELTILLKNGSTISLKGADNYDSLRGVGLDYLVMDEFADIDPEAFYEVLRPTLSDKEGGALFIGTPKGKNWAYDLFCNAEDFPDEWSSYQFTTLDGGNVKPEEIEAARRTLDERTFRQEFMASWETFSGRIFYAFDRTNNVKKYAPINEQLPHELHIGIDFNIDPMSAAVFVKEKDTLLLIDEIRIFGSNTQELVDEIKSRYPNQRIIAYPDPAGRQRKTSAGGRTDFTILQNAGFTVRAPHAHNPVRDGINAVNAKLRSSTGITTLFIDPGCKYSIETFEKFCYKEGSSQPDKESGFDHLGDAIRYCVEFLFPIRQPIQEPSRKLWTHNLARV
jgi:hypothetical protein